MKVAVIGSRSITDLDLSEYLPEGITEIISGGARGVDTLARNYAIAHGIKLTEILPDYDLYGRSAPIRRNDLIIDRADCVIAFWDGESHGTLYVIRRCREIGKPLRAYRQKLLRAPF